MALKRSAKSSGKPVNKPMASAVRHVDVKAKQQMVGGETYEGWRCKNKACGALIAIANPPPAGARATESEDHLTAVKCPHCGDEDLYHWNGRGRHVHAPRS